MKHTTLKPSNHLLRYDAQTYEQQGFIETRNRVRDLAQKPRHWSVSVTCMTQDPATGDKLRTHFNFRPIGRYMLSELAPVINEEIHAHDDYLPDCLSVMVVARIMTEGGK